jgi:hypothetical protein
MRAVLALPILVACTGGDTDTGTESPCADRTGGAEIVITVNDETFRFWSTNAAFIDAAQAHYDAGSSQVALFNDLVTGTDCDEQWTFHVDPDAMEWADFAIEVCDGRPSDVEGDQAYWIDQLDQWCPWGPEVTSIDDRR